LQAQKESITINKKPIHFIISKSTMITYNLEKIKQQIPLNVQLVVVSKYRPIEQLMEVYNTGQRDFAENRVQELLGKFQEMPKDIKWHLIGHLQSNKVKIIVGFVHLIHSLDSVELAIEIDKQAAKINRVIPVLLQFHVAQEDSKFGIKPIDAEIICKQILELPFIEIKGIMGMASFTEDESLIRKEFQLLKSIFENLKEKFFMDKLGFDTISMGMSSDFKIAIEVGSNLVRVGSLVFEKI